MSKVAQNQPLLHALSRPVHTNSQVRSTVINVRSTVINHHFQFSILNQPILEGMDPIDIRDSNTLDLPIGVKVIRIFITD